MDRIVFRANEKLEEENGYIYRLIDPETSETRYIGQCHAPETRYGAHLNEKTDTEKTNWIQSLKDKKLNPIMRVDWQINDRYLDDYEKKEIMESIERGDNLTNRLLPNEKIVLDTVHLAKIFSIKDLKVRTACFEEYFLWCSNRCHFYVPNPENVFSNQVSHKEIYEQFLKLGIMYQSGICEMAGKRIPEYEKTEIPSGPLRRC